MFSSRIGFAELGRWEYSSLVLFSGHLPAHTHAATWAREIMPKFRLKVVLQDSEQYQTALVPCILVPLYLRACSGIYCAYEEPETRAKDLRANQLIPALKPRVSSGTGQVKGNTGLCFTPKCLSISQGFPPMVHKTAGKGTWMT